MTVSGDFIPVADVENLAAAPAYPTAFGVTFTPVISGALLAVAGLGLAAYLGVNFLQPAWEQNQSLSTDVQAKQEQVRQQEASLNKIAEARANLERAKQRRLDVMTLFADEKTLDTLLLDLNRLVAARNVKLNSFTPAQEGAKIIDDGSLGESVNGQLKRKEIALDIEGTFEQTQSLVRSIERLQPLLLVKNFNTNLDRSEQKIVVSPQGKVVSSGATATSKLKTTFKLEALVPVPPEERVAPPAAAPQ